MLKKLKRKAKKGASAVVGGDVGGNSLSDQTSDERLEGKWVVVGQMRVQVQKKAAEGGFGFVYIARDEARNEYALKRVFVMDSADMVAAKRECEIHESLPAHKHVVKICGWQAFNDRSEMASTSVESGGAVKRSFFDSEVDHERGGALEEQRRSPSSSSSFGRSGVMLLTEYCHGGGLVEELNRIGAGGLSESKLWHWFGQICLAVAHLHSQPTPIIHRDIKAESMSPPKHLVCSLFFFY
jgi:serine/threonine protein kinase